MNRIYKCSICGNVVELLHDGEGSLICCGKPMKLLDEKNNDEGMEKHVPVVNQTKNGIEIKIGLKEHPMEEKHHIKWIEASFDEKTEKKFLHPGEKPEARFNIEREKVIARCYCNIHGLWKK